MFRVLRIVAASACLLMLQPEFVDAAGTEHAASPHAKRKRHKSKRPRAGRGYQAGDTTSAAYRYGNLTQDECEAELTTREIQFERVEARGVAAPVRLRGPLHGVEFRSNDASKTKPDSVYEIADCRLVLALDDFALILEQHNVIAVEPGAQGRLYVGDRNDGSGIWNLTCQNDATGRGIPEAARWIWWDPDDGIPPYDNGLNRTKAFHLYRIASTAL